MSPAEALRALQRLRLEQGAYGLRLQRDAQGRAILLSWGDDGIFRDPSGRVERERPAPWPIADALDLAEACPDGTAALDAMGRLHLETFDATCPQAGRLLGRLGRTDVRLPNRGPGFGGACPLPDDGTALLLLPDDSAPPLSGHRALAAAARAAAAGFPPTVPTPIPGLRNGLLVLRRHGRVVLVPIDDAGTRIASWPLHPSVRQREEG